MHSQRHWFIRLILFIERGFLRVLSYLESHKLLVIPLIITFIVLSIIGYNQVAKITFLRDFYQQVANVESKASRLQIDNLVAKTEIREGDKRNSRTGKTIKKAILPNCSNAGVYRNYQTDKTVYFAYTCMKGVVHFYGINSIDTQTIKKIEDKLAALGWRIEANRPGFENQLLSTMSKDKRDHETAQFIANDGSLARLSIDKQSDFNLAEWCPRLEECEIIGTSMAYPYYITVQMYAYKDYE